MSAIAKHLVRHRRLYFLLTCAAALFMGILFLRVPLITDMTRYLPDGSAMKAGVDIMAEEFSGLSLSNTIRVMFTDVPEEEKPKLLEEISGIEYVDSVSYTAGDPHFEKDGHTLFTLNFGYDYGSPEVSAIEAELRSQFSGLYEMPYSVDDTTGGKVPVILMVLAIIMIIAILTFMSSSWIEPYLYLLAIGKLTVSDLICRGIPRLSACLDHTVIKVLSAAICCQHALVAHSSVFPDTVMHRRLVKECTIKLSCDSDAFIFSIYYNILRRCCFLSGLFCRL